MAECKVWTTWNGRRFFRPWRKRMVTRKRPRNCSVSSVQRSTTRLSATPFRYSVSQLHVKLAAADRLAATTDSRVPALALSWLGLEWRCPLPQESIEPSSTDCTRSAARNDHERK